MGRTIKSGRGIKLFLHKKNYGFASQHIPLVISRKNHTNIELPCFFREYNLSVLKMAFSSKTPFFISKVQKLQKLVFFVQLKKITKCPKKVLFSCGTNLKEYWLQWTKHLGLEISLVRQLSNDPPHGIIGIYWSSCP